MVGMWGRNLPKLHGTCVLHEYLFYQDGKGHCIHYVIIKAHILLTEATGENKNFMLAKNTQLFW